MPRTCPLFLLVLLTLLAGAATPAAEVESPPADKEPLLRVDARGPVAFVSAMAFSPDGKTLYAGGWDKVIRVWTQDDKGEFQLSPSSYRVPVGPGPSGAINALALSPDGNWLAVAGNGVDRNVVGFRQLGFIVPSFGVRDPDALEDVGIIYVFSTRDRSVRMLRGHRGPVRALTFGPSRGKDIPPLLSVAVEEKAGNAVETQLTARLWDPNQRESFASLSGLPSEELKTLFPGVALWPPNEGAGALRAALALRDGNLRLWEPSRDRVRPQEIEDLRQNVCLAHLGRGRLLTAGYDLKSKQWRLLRWLVPAKGQPEWDRSCFLGERNNFPLALGLLSRKANGTADLAAVLVVVEEKKGGPYRYHLRIAEVAGEKLRVVDDMELWRDTEPRQPPVATSLRGRHLAVANNADHTIRIYTVRDLLGAQEPVSQKLRTGAVFFRHASFVRRGKDWGLRLKREQKGDWVFDFAKRRLTDNLTDWKAASPKASTWEPELTDDRRKIRVSDGGKQIASIAIPEKEIVTHYHLLPPGESVKLPLLAVASHEGGEPLLTIYNAKSGEPLRRLTGHTERLRSLAFAPDGRLLVSTADDGTVCVWSLTDLDTIVDKHGRLPGVTVGPVGKGAKAVKVLEVKSKSPVHGKLKEGDVLTALVQKGKPQPIASPRGFYEALYQLRPGAEVSLRRGSFDGKDDIRFVVGQGIDERKPLFSLFVIGGAKASDCDWIGWTPVGPYDRSKPEAEKYLGWHFNTGDPQAPTRFADAGQYRKFYYRENLLEQLIQRGALGWIEPPRLPAPVLDVRVKDEDRSQPRREHEAVIVRRPRLDLTVGLSKRPLSSLSALTWQLDEDEAKSFDLDQRGEASFQVPLTLSRGQHRFVVTARTRDISSPPTRKELILRYQPLPPEVVIKDAARQPHVRQRDFTLEASITPKVSGEDVSVTILHRNDEGKEEPHEQTLAGRVVRAGAAFPLKQRLKLYPGNNEIEVSAINAGALAGAQEQETGRKKTAVFYYFEAKPPAIAFQRVVPAGGGTALPVDLSGPMIVRRPVVKVIGQIKAEDEPLTEAQWDHGTATPADRLAGFKPGKDKEFFFEQRLTLKPGKQTIRLRARTKNTKKDGENSFELIYQPPVPMVTSLTAPLDGALLEGSDPTKTIRVRGQVQFPADAMPYRATILVNDKPASRPLVLDEKTGLLAGNADIGSGENRIRVAIGNEWGASSSSDVVVVHYVRPPVITGKPTHKPVRGTSLIDLEVPVRSWATLKPELVSIEVNGTESIPKQILPEKGEENRWTVHLLSVPLDAGSREQRIVVRLANTEAPCRDAADFTIQSEKVLPAPEAQFLEPRQDKTAWDPRTTIRFQVRSKSKLETVRLLRDGVVLRSFDASGVPAIGDEYELTESTKVMLNLGDNRLSLDVVSVSGRLSDSPRLLLTYTPPPLQIKIDNLTEVSWDGPALEPRRPEQEQGLVHFPQAKSGQVWLHGEVLWTSKGENWRDDYFLLRVFVNGFQQKPFYVQRAPDKSETSFQVQLLLNRPTDNRIRLVASRLVEGNLTECVVHCAKPITAQRLYVLALSPYSEPDTIEKRLKEAISDLQQQKGGRPSAFQKVEILKPLTRYLVNPEYIGNPLSDFEERVLADRKDAKQQSELMNDVLMIYYEGREKIDDKGHFFETYSPAGANAFDMPCDTLADSLEKVPGAHVLLLDVDRPALREQDVARDKIKDWKDKFPNARSHVVVVRWARRSVPGRPGPVRLMPVLQKQIPQAARLSKLIALIEEALNASNDRHLLIFTKWLPPELANLRFGASP